MKSILIKINELKINNYDRHNDSFTLNIALDISGKKEFLKKFDKISKPEIMARDLINFVKEDTKSKNKPTQTDNLIEDLVIIRYAEDLEELEPKLISFFKRFNDLVKNFKNRGYSENYLMTYRTVDGFSQKF